MPQSAHAIQTAAAQVAAGKFEQAKATLRCFLQRHPADANAIRNLGILHAKLSEHEQAFFHIERALALGGEDPSLRCILGNLYLRTGRHKKGAEAYRECIKRAPKMLSAYDGLGRCLLCLGDGRGAAEAYEAGIRAQPDEPTTYLAMAESMSLVGRVGEALDALRRGVARLPEDCGLNASLCYQLNFSDEVDADEHFRAHQRLGDLMARRPSRPDAAFNNSPDPDRKLNVALLSPDFREHACGLFLESLVTHLNGDSIAVFCYSTRAEDDAMSRRFRALPGWRACDAMSDAQLAEQARRDGIDILVECSGWTSGHRLAALTPRIAPVQATYLGYPNTTGLATIDYRIVDGRTDPCGAEAYCTEALVRLAGCFLCFRPADNSPEPQLTGALTDDPGAPITFGSFARLSKVSDRLVRVWADVLRRVPNSRILLKSPIVSDDVKAHYGRLFEEQGVSAERVAWSDFVPGLTNHLGLYRQMDIALDSFPYNGTTTTCEAVWMGVPVVTLEGKAHRARVGASLLSALGLPDLIARDEEGYVDIAVRLAGDRAALAELHRTLRGQMAASALCDGAGFARRFEGGLREAWREKCAAGRHAAMGGRRP